MEQNSLKNIQIILLTLSVPGHFNFFVIMCGIAANSTSLAHSAWPLHSPLNKNMQADDSLVHIATVETIIQ
jgi:hypothetical protein